MPERKAALLRQNISVLSDLMLSRCSVGLALVISLNLGNGLRTAAARVGRGLAADAGSPLDLHQQMKQLRGQNKVLMAPVEQALIEQYLEPHHVMLEWGSGYSTLWTNQVGRRRTVLRDGRDMCAMKALAPAPGLCQGRRLLALERTLCASLIKQMGIAPRSKGRSLLRVAG